MISETDVFVNNFFHTCLHILEHDLVFINISKVNTVYEIRMSLLIELKVDRTDLVSSFGKDTVQCLVEVYINHTWNPGHQ